MRKVSNINLKVITTTYLMKYFDFYYKKQRSFSRKNVNFFCYLSYIGIGMTIARILDVGGCC